MELYLVAASFIAVYAVIVYLSSQRRFLRTQPWTGKKFTAAFQSVFGARDLLFDGYKKNRKLFVLPQLSSDPFVILPAEAVHEFLAAGDHRVDHHTVGRETIAMQWTIGTGFSGDAHFDVVRRQLTRKLPLLTADVYAELILGMEDQWNPQADWNTVNIYPTCMRIVARAANRVFSGKELCRNAEYLESSRLYSQNVFMSGMILRLLPTVLHPIVAPFVTRGVKKHLATCMKHAVPVIESRMKGEPQNDVLQWVLEDSAHKGSAWICRCLLLLNMVAIHTTSMVTTNTLMDLYTSPDRDEFVAGLREECERVQGPWTKDAVNGLIRVDSAIRETMRQTGLGDIGIPRIVKDRNGIDLKGGLHIPYGVRVAVPAHAIHNDDRFYPNADKWDAFRFSRPYENAHDLATILERKNRGLVVTTDDFFSFGFGKHACPGRFFASQEMKLMIAHIVMHYDIEIDGPRPENLLVNCASVPKDEVQMRIKLRS